MANKINTTYNAGTGIIYTTAGNVNSIGLDNSLIEYIDLLYKIHGIDINFEIYKSMSTSEKESFIRDIKIKKLLENDLPENK